MNLQNGVYFVMPLQSIDRY